MAEKGVRIMAGLKKIECDPKCGFMVRSHDESEVVKIAMKHAKKSHDMDVTESDARGMLEDA
jgi:predicted small metal-binding protein